jgi:uncharacterized protein
LPDWLIWPGLFLLGGAVGVYGTIIGAGGGFVLVPLLIFIYPEMEPEVVTAISLGVVFFNALSGAQAYARHRRIDYVAGGIFAASTVPGAVVGALATGMLAASLFEVAFALVLMLVAVWIVLPRPRGIRVSPPGRRHMRRTITDSLGDTYVYSFDPLLGAVLGLAIGVVASLFGVGGGIFLVPAMVLLMRFPAHISTSTSTFVLLFTAGTGALVHLVAGHYNGVEAEELSLSAGVLIGAQIGALVSRALVRHQEVVTRLFATALVLVSLRLLAGALL